MQLTELEYNVIMQAINDAFETISNDNFIDPYNNEENYTNEQMFEALKSVESKLMDLWTK